MEVDRYPASPAVMERWVEIEDLVGAGRAAEAWQAWRAEYTQLTESDIFALSIADAGLICEQGGRILMELEKWDEADQLFSCCLRRDDLIYDHITRREVAVDQGLCRLKMGRSSAAIESFTTALDIPREGHTSRFLVNKCLHTFALEVHAQAVEDEMRLFVSERLMRRFEKKSAAEQALKVKSYQELAILLEQHKNLVEPVSICDDIYFRVEPITGTFGRQPYTKRAYRWKQVFDSCTDEQIHKLPLAAAEYLLRTGCTLSMDIQDWSQADKVMTLMVAHPQFGQDERTFDCTSHALCTFLMVSKWKEVESLWRRLLDYPNQKNAHIRHGILHGISYVSIFSPDRAVESLVSGLLQESLLKLGKSKAARKVSTAKTYKELDELIKAVWAQDALSNSANP